jgi:branched-chain amino acid transport system ATP-binding protein
LIQGVGLTKRFGGLVAVDGVDFEVDKGTILGLVGPNGAGKTTILNIISGIYRPDKGRVIFNGVDITGFKPHQCCRMGIGRTFQITQPFPDLTVFENILIGAIFGRRGREGDMGDARERVLNILDFVGFTDKRDHPAKTLNVAQLKRLELARTLATDPELLLLDEVTTGLNERESQEASQLIEKIRHNGMTIIMVEHIMKVIMNLSDSVMVLDHGRKIAEGTPREIASDREVIKAYLGEKYNF